MASPLSTRTAERVVYDSPLAVDHSLQPRGFQPSEVCRRYKRYIPESQDYIVGPMPPQEFLDEFLLATDQEGMCSPRYAFRKVPSRATTPAGIFEPLVGLLFALHHGCIY